MRTCRIAVAALIFALPAPGAGAQGSFSLAAVRLSTPPAIDGVVGDAEWSGSAKATDFVQYEPRRGEPSPFRTEALVAYDTAHLYVAFRAWDEEPLIGQLTQRDSDLLTDDSVSVLIDTYADRRTGYLFMTNVLGTQADFRVADDGRQVDGSWDSAWQSAARRTEFGWSAEFAIPLASIKFAAGERRAWGLNLGRSRRRTLEFSTWAGPLDARARVSQGGWLSGLNVPAPQRRQQVIPFGIARLGEGGPAEWQAGVDARYAVTPRMSVYAAFNPDFATIEADQEEINLTRFEVSLKEKRQFFLEGQELFGQRIQTFYSRRVSDLAGGGKLLGRAGSWTLVAMTAQAPGGGESSTRGNFAVARAQRDVFGRSNVAVMVANRHVDGASQGSIGVDANLFFSKTLGMTAQFVKSYGRFRSGTLAYFVRPSYDSSTGHVHVRLTNLGNRVADNVNAIGLVKDDDRREIDAAAEKTVWVERGPVERVQYLSNYNAYWSQAGLLRGWEVRQSLESEFRSQVSAKFSYIGDFRRYEKDFTNRQIGLEVGYNTRAYQSVRVGYKAGRSFDSDFGLWTATARRKITDSLSAEYELQRLTMSPDPDRKSTWIHVVRANQFFTKDLFLRLFAQTNSAIDRKNVQAVFVYRYMPPFGTLQLAFQRGTAAFGQRSSQGNTLFLKMTTVF